MSFSFMYIYIYIRVCVCVCVCVQLCNIYYINIYRCYIEEICGEVSALGRNRAV